MPGSTIEVEDAIKGIVTRSANDAAVVVAEAIAGDEDDFAELMTRKAQALGMSRTVYKNASGLPDDDQVTTARDQSVLGRAIQERFPRYYKYFSTRSFTFRGQWISNHNRLLGKVEGVDGIKTGYIRASGFNLVTSVNRGNRYVVAVVMGGDSAGSRDARMRDLISEHIGKAATKRSAPMVAEAGSESKVSETKVAAKAEPKPEPRIEPKAEPKAAAKPEPKVAAKPAPKPEPKAETKSEQRYAVASAGSVPVRLAAAKAEPAAGAAPPVATGSTEPIRPILVKTFTVRAGSQSPSPAPAHLPAPTTAVAPPAAQAAAFAKVEAPPKAEVPPPAPVARPPVAAAAPVRTAEVAALPAPIAAPAPAAAPASAPALAFAPAAPAKPHSGWIIQVGAFPGEQEAKQRLSAVQSKAAKVLAGNDPYTESVLKGGTTYYRARFAGFDQDKAEAACKYLKRNDVECISVRN